MIVLVVSNLLFLVRDIGRKEELGGSAEYFARELKNMPPMNVEEAMSLALFLLATLLSFTRQFYQDMLPD